MKIITGITVEEQTKKAKEILENIVKPLNKKYDELERCVQGSMESIKQKGK